MTQIRFVAACAALLFLAAPAAAQEHPHQHPADSLGTVHFATSCAPAVAPRFDRAVALLHSFEFGASIRAFGEVLAADSTVRDGAVGDRAEPLGATRWRPRSARSPRSSQRGRRRRREAAARLGARRDRARARVHRRGRPALRRLRARRTSHARVVAYERAMGDLVAKQPADTEATIFHAIALVAVGAAHGQDVRERSCRRARILEPLWATQPDHPGLAHYIIHAYDVPALAARARGRGAALRADRARRRRTRCTCRRTPSRASGCGRSRSRRTAARSTAALRDGSIAEELHASDYSTYAYLQTARATRRRRRCSTRCRRSRRASTRTRSRAPRPGRPACSRWRRSRRATRSSGAPGREAATLEPARERVPVDRGDESTSRARSARRTRATRGRARASIDSLAAIRQRARRAGRALLGGAGRRSSSSRAQAWLDRAQRRDSAGARAHARGGRRARTRPRRAAVTPGPLAPGARAARRHAARARAAARGAGRVSRHAEEGAEPVSRARRRSRRRGGPATVRPRRTTARRSGRWAAGGNRAARRELRELR